MKKSKILFVLGSMWRGGAERVASILANRFVDLGYDVDIILLLESEVRYDLSPKINIIAFPRRSRSFISVIYWIRSIRKTLKLKEYSKIISFAARINILTLIANSMKIPIIISERNDPKNDNRDFISKILIKILYPKASLKVFQTLYAKSCFSSEIQKKSIILPNPINNLCFKKYNISENNDSLISIGRLVKQKNHKLLIEVMKMIDNDDVDFSLRIYGEGPLKDELSLLIKNYNLSHKIKIFRNSNKIYEQINKAQIFILTSKYEGMPNALLESMALKKICISSNYNGVNDVLENESNGFIFKSEDRISLYKTIKKALLNRKNETIKENAYKKALEFKEDIIIKRWVKIIDETN